DGIAREVHLWAAEDLLGSGDARRVPEFVPGPLLPAYLVAGFELPPERELRLARCDLGHHRADRRLLRLEEPLEAFRIRPIVEPPDLGLAAVEAVGDHPLVLGPLRDAA